MSRVPFRTRVAVGAIVTLVADSQRRREQLRKQFEEDMDRRVEEFLDRIEEARVRYEAMRTAPMNAASEFAQRIVRLQQTVTQLAIRGDEALAPFITPPEEQPTWATFDEDLDDEGTC